MPKRSPSRSIAYCTASVISNSPRGDGLIERQASKMAGPNRQQFMLTPSGRGKRASVASSGFSMIRCKRRGAVGLGDRLDHGELRDPLGRDIAFRHQGLLVEDRDRRPRGVAQPAKGLQRVVVVGIDHHEGPLADDLLGGGDGVGGAQRLDLHGELDRHPPRPQLRVVLLHLAVLRSHDQAGPRDAGVGRHAHDIIQERPADGDHRLDAAIRGRRQGSGPRPPPGPISASAFPALGRELPLDPLRPHVCQIASVAARY